QDRDPLEVRAPGLFNLLYNKYWIDEFYGATVGRLSAGSALAWSWFDRNVLDRIINGIGILTLFFSRVNFIIDDTLLNDGPDALANGTVASGDVVRHGETGKIQDYLSLIFAGVVLLGLIFIYWLKGA